MKIEREDDKRETEDEIGYVETIIEEDVSPSIVYYALDKGKENCEEQKCPGILEDRCERIDPHAEQESQWHDYDQDPWRDVSALDCEGPFPEKAPGIPQDERNRHGRETKDVASHESNDILPAGGSMPGKEEHVNWQDNESRGNHKTSEGAQTEN